MDDDALRAEVRGQRPETRGQRTEVRDPTSDLRLLTSVMVVMAVLLSCAGPKTVGPVEKTSEAVDSVVFAQREKDRKAPLRLPVNLPVQVSFEADPVRYGALSGDGNTLAYVLENQSGSSLWIRPRDFTLGTLPQKRLEGMGRISAPALSRDGSSIVFVATDHDAKGDIFLLSTQGGSDPKRLTGRDTADGAPTFSPDGNRIYYHRLLTEEILPHLAYMDLSAGAKGPETLREGAFPSISPDGERLAFVSFEKDSGGDIQVLDLKTGKVTPVTAGSPQDLYPTWSLNGKWIYFSRFDLDTNKDNAVIWRAAPDDAGLWAYPLTSETFSAYQPMATSSELLFLSNRNGTANLWRLPSGGEIPIGEDAPIQMERARILAAQIPQKDALALLAYYKVLEDFSREIHYGGKTLYEIGKLYQRMGREKQAVQTYERLMKDFGNAYPEKALAAIRLTEIQAENAWKAAPTDFKRKQILLNAQNRIQALLKTGIPSPSDTDALDSARIRARGLMVQAQLLEELDPNPDSLGNAIALLDQVAGMKNVASDLRAEAIFQKARINSRMGQAQAVIPAYLSIVTTYPDTPWADAAVERIIDNFLSDSSGNTVETRIQALARLAETHQESVPKLAMGAFNRMGDEAFAAGDRQQAKRWYREVLNRYAMSTGSPTKENLPPTQVAAARLALAEILYREELFRQALDLYETEMAHRPYEDRLYTLARAAYIQKSLAAADFLFNLGEIPAARKRYGDLIRENPDLVQAHRGYIKCAAAMKQIDPCLERYRAQLKTDPENPILLYAAGLCLTYREGKKAHADARTLITKAILKQGQTAYFHQTLGYLFEVSETVYGEPGGLEKALLSYQKAYFLNNPEQDPQNSANLALNLGNIHFLLGQYGRALTRYQERLESKAPFDHEDTEILFYRRLGGAAFQMNDPAVSIDAYTRALQLIDDRIDPGRPSELMGKLNTFIFDRILTPALKRSKNAKDIEAMTQRQRRIHKALFHATGQPHNAPPDPRWESYRKTMETIMAEQEKLIGDIAPLITEKRDETPQTLSFMLTRARDALQFPNRMIELKAEILDRLGLACQEAGKWEEATDAFEKAFQLNQGLGRLKNLAANRRSVAYNTYMAAGDRSGKEKERLLKDALKQFEEMQGLLDQYGVVDPSEKKAGSTSRAGDGESALLKVSLDLALDKTTGSEAVYGFSPTQEKRLAQAFISRIETELGMLEKAQTAIDGQLLPYHQAKTVRDQDLYGVSLLSHRDGQLRFALQEPKKAFSSFQRSAQLALKLKNPASAAMNLENMAWAMGRISTRDPDYPSLRAGLATLDRETIRLLERAQGVLDPLTLPHYHNRMGALALKPVSIDEGLSPEGAARDMMLLSRAGAHFTLGLTALKKTEGKRGKSDRKALALAAALQLNMAHVALDFDERETAKAHAKSALEIAGRGLLPQYEWRALVILGDLTAALKSLSSAPLADAGCAPGEIRTAFAPMVLSLIQKEKAEDALNLLERLSELERFHRMAPMVSAQVSPSEQARLLEIFPRLMTLLRLREQLKGAEEEEKPHLAERIRQERTLLDEDSGKKENTVKLPALLTRSETLREQLVLLLGLACEIERVATLAVVNSSEESDNPQKTLYRELMTLYPQIWKEIKRVSAREGTPGVAALFGPDPVEAIDLMENLPKGGHAVRLFEKDSSGKGWTVFVVTEDDISVETTTLSLQPPPSTLLIYEDPWVLPSGQCPVALSATHLVRSVANRKPFKRRMVELAGPYKLPSDFDVTLLPASADQEAISEALPGAQGLLLGGPVYTANSVPTRPGEVPVYQPAMGLDQGRTLPLLTLFDRLSDVSLAMLPRADAEETYMLGHLFSLMGVPTLLLPRNPSNPSPVVPLFFEAYGKNPVYNALMTALKKTEGRRTLWVNLGYWGMTEAEALILAERRFKEYVQKGISAFKKKEPVYALVLFEKALMVARQVQVLSRYEPQLLVYARESAYAGGRYESAVQHARDLVKFWARKKPDSKDQAEALVKLGLVLARIEQYDRSIAALEEGTEIMANLELADLQVAALNDLGVVLENATHYNRALTQFQTAADLSRNPDKKGALARQHMRMGRVYDLRLSQYPKAKIHYLKACALYETLNDTENMAQALLDAGRCDRLLGNFKEAENQYEKALALLDKGKEGLNAENQIMAGILMEQTNNHWFQARYQDAWKGQRQVHEMAVKNRWTLEEVNSLNTAGLIWWTLGNHPSALRQLEEALALAKTLHVRRDEVAATLNNMGLVYRDAGDYEKALAALEQALAIDRNINSKWAIAYDLKNLGLTRLAMGEAEKALPLFQEALELARQIGNRINQAKILVAYGEALMTLDRSEEANARFTQALDLSRQMALREVEWRALFGLGQLQLKEGKKAEARVLLESAVKVIEGMRAEIKLDQLKDGFINNKMAVYETLVGLLVDMGHNSEAFYVAERSRARNLIDLLGNQRLTLHGAVNQDRYDTEKRLKTQMAEYETLMAQAADANEKAVYQKALDQTRDKHRDLMLEIQLKNPELASILSVDPLTLSQVQKFLKPETAILAYYVLPDEILCWFITRDGMELFKTPLGRKTLAQKVLDYRRTLQNLEPPEAEAGELYTWLLAPLKDRLKTVKTIGVVPHHILHHLSFATLFDGKQYLVDRFPLFSIPSASVLRHTQQTLPPEKNTKVLAVGNPDLNNPALALPFAEKEVSTIGWNFPHVTVLTGNKATEGWVVRNISDFGIIHLASHGTFDPVNPLFSAIKLAQDGQDDGDLRASEVFGLDIRANLVMLSACQTGLGKITSGDDVIGMNRAFLYAGTNAVMSSLWRVSDISTALLVKQFYREYQNRPKAESLNRAMRHVKNRYPHPGYWGAFVLVGDYR